MDSLNSFFNLHQVIHSFWKLIEKNWDEGHFKSRLFNVHTVKQRTAYTRMLGTKGKTLARRYYFSIILWLGSFPFSPIPPSPNLFPFFYLIKTWKVNSLLAPLKKIKIPSRFKLLWLSVFQVNNQVTISKFDAWEKKIAAYWLASHGNSLRQQASWQQWQLLEGPATQCLFAIQLSINPVCKYLLSLNFISGDNEQTQTMNSTWADPKVCTCMA